MYPYAAEKRCLCWSIVIIFVIIMIMTAIVVLIDWLQSQHKSGTTNAYLVETLPLGLVRSRARICF